MSQHKQVTSWEKYGNLVSGVSEMEQSKDTGGCGKPDKPQQLDQTQTHDLENCFPRVWEMEEGIRKFHTFCANV